MLERLQLTDFGPYATADLRLGALTVLVGPNNSGKTTLLRALQTLRLATLQGAQPLVRARLGGPGTWTLEAGFSAETAVKLVGPGSSDLARPELRVGESVLGDDEDGAEQLRRWGYFGGQAGVHGVLRDTAFYRSPPPPLAAVLSAVARMRQIRMVRLDPSQSRRDSAASSNWSDWVDAGASRGLPSALASLVADDPAAGSAILAELTREFPEYRSYSTSLVALEGKARTHHRLSFSTRAGAQLSSAEVSDGVIFHLSLLALTHAPSPPSMLLIEEPIAGVHPSRIEDTCARLRNWAERTGCQVVLTSYNPYFLDAVRPGEAWFCRRGADGVATVSCFADVEEIDRELRVRSLGEVWSALAEERLFQRTRGK